MHGPITLRALTVALLAAVPACVPVMLKVMPIQAQDQRPSVDVAPKSAIPLDVRPQMLKRGQDVRFGSKANVAATSVAGPLSATSEPLIDLFPISYSF